MWHSPLGWKTWTEHCQKKRKVLQKGSGAATTQRKQKGRCFPLNRGRTLQSYQLSLNHWLHKKAFLQNVTNNCLRGNPHWTYLSSFPNNIIQKIKLTEKHFSLRLLTFCFLLLTLFWKSQQQSAHFFFPVVSEEFCFSKTSEWAFHWPSLYYWKRKGRLKCRLETASSIF